MRLFLIIIYIVVSHHFALCQSVFYDVQNIQEIELSFSQTNWDYQLDTANMGSGGYMMADFISINGSIYDSVGVKYKGNSSYDSSYSKNPLHISLDKFKNQSYRGLKDIKLGNGYADPSLLREVLSYSILKDYMDCPAANFAKLHVNGKYIGLYSNVESVDKDFCSNHFYSSSKAFFKCNPLTLPSPVTKSNLKYKAGLDSSAYFNFYEMKSNAGWNNLVDLCDTVCNFPAAIHTVLDVDRAIWMLAFNNLLVNLDSYSGVFAQNYYLYRDNTKRFNPIVWDLNMSFGGFPFAGSGSTGMGTLSISNMQQIPTDLHAADANWPLIKSLLSNPIYKRIYIAHMRTILQDYFLSNNYFTLALQFQTLIDTAALNDSNKFYNYVQFKNAITTPCSIGSYSVPGIAQLMTARTSFLQSTSDFIATPPTITGISVSDTIPLLNTALFINANVYNASANSVFLNWRSTYGDKFQQEMMYDDGLHNDGMPGDNKFGAAITINTALIQYYIYAENASAGIFSPAKAEHEFYSISATVHTPSKGQLVINEFQANNINDTLNENGNFSDWIELYNTSIDTIGLKGLYLSDTYLAPFKFALPPYQLILPHTYLTIWADENTSTSQSIHCNFKLSQAGEQLLLSNKDSLVLDSIGYGPQAADISFGRCPNGIGVFQTMTQSSLGRENCPNGIESNELISNAIILTPNPATEWVYVSSNPPGYYQLVNLYGQIIWSKNYTDNFSFSVAELSSGIYFLMNQNRYRKLIVYNLQ